MSLTLLRVGCWCAIEGALGWVHARRERDGETQYLVSLGDDPPVWLPAAALRPVGALRTAPIQTHSLSSSVCVRESVHAREEAGRG